MILFWFEMLNKLIYLKKHLQRGWFLFLIASLLWMALQPGSAVQADTPHPIYLPLAVGAASSSGDLVLQRIEVTQGVQDTQNSLPLVEGRPALLRIYAENHAAAGGAQTLKDVAVAVSASNGGMLLTGAPRMVRAQVESSANPAIISSTINFTLPSDWLQGSYDLQVTINADHALGDSDASNNSKSLHLVFHPLPALDIKVIPIAYTSQSDGALYPPPTQDTISNFIQRVYPISKVNLSWHAPYAFQGDLNSLAGFTTLLSQMSALKALDGAPEDQVYYALIPIRNDQGAWFTAGFVGLGYIGKHVAVGLDYNNAGQTAAHEIGHNLGRSHAPCGFPSQPDAQYPYPNANIGQYGLDVSSSTLFLPDLTKDFMSYCNPSWVSDYTYRALFDQLSAQALSAGAGLSARPAQSASGRPMLLVRAQVNSDGAELFPPYAVVTSQAAAVVPAAAPGADYHIELVDSQGQVLVDMPVQAVEIATEADARAYGIESWLPLPPQAVSEVRLLRGDEMLSEYPVDLLSASHTNSLEAVASQDPSGTQSDGSEMIAKQVGDHWVLQWGNPDARAVVRFSPDNGASWTVLGVDVTGGQFTVPSSLLSSSTSRFEVILSAAIP